jgi:hypothetical protein
VLLSSAFRAFNKTEGADPGPIIAATSKRGGVKFSLLPDGTIAGERKSDTPVNADYNPHASVREVLTARDALGFTALELACISAASAAGSEAAHLLWQVS